jgi:hypothetical protein
VDVEEVAGVVATLLAPVALLVEAMLVEVVRVVNVTVE